MRLQQGAALLLQQQTICHDELCPIPRVAQRPLQEGCESWSWAGRLGGEWAKGKVQGGGRCVRETEEGRMLAEDTEKDRSWMVMKAAGYLHLSSFLTFQLTVQNTWYLL